MTQNEAEFSLTVAWKDISSSGSEIRFEVDEAVRAALAERYDILELRSLRGSAKLRPYRKAGLTLDCDFSAELVQACVVTLEPVVQQVEDHFTRRYLPENELLRRQAHAPAVEVNVDAEAEDEPELMENGRIDIGEAVAEELALAMDPYPRKDGISFEPVIEDEVDDAPETKPNPFSILEKLKKNN